MKFNMISSLKNPQWKKKAILILLSIVVVYLFMKQINNIEGLNGSDQNSILLHVNEKVKMKTCSDKDTTDFSKIYKETISEIDDNKEKYIIKLKSIIENNEDGNYMIASSIYQTLQNIFITNQQLKRAFVQYKHTYINIKCQKNKQYTLTKSKFKQDLLKTFRTNPEGRMIRMLLYYIRRRIKLRNDLLRYIDTNKKYLDTLGNDFKKETLIESTKMKEVDVFIDKLEEKIKKQITDEIKRKKTYNDTKEASYMKKMLEGKIGWWEKRRLNNLIIENENMNFDIANMGYTVPRSLSNKEDVPETNSNITPPPISSTLKKDLKESSDNIKKGKNIV